MRSPSRFMRAVGDSYIPAYLPVVQRNRERTYGERERQFQLYRRGRYVEFNLVLIEQSSELVKHRQDGISCRSESDA